MPKAKAPPIPHHYQETDVTCGPAALKMVFDALWGIKVEEEALAAHLGTNDEVGTRQKVITRFLERVGLDVVERHSDTTLDELRALVRAGRVVVVSYWIPAEDTDHYALVQAIGADHIVLQDPWFGPDVDMDLDDFDRRWVADRRVATRRDRWLVGILAPTGGTAAAERTVVEGTA